MNNGRFNFLHAPLLWFADDTFIVLADMTFSAVNGDVIRVPVLPRVRSDGKLVRLGFLSDGGSKPMWANAIPHVGDRCDELMLAYVQHDALYTLQTIERSGVVVSIDRAYADAMLREISLYIGGDPTKVAALVDAVQWFGAEYWRSTPVDPAAVMPEATTEDFAVCPYILTPA